MHDPIRQVGMLADDVVKTLIGGDHGILFLYGEREVETVMGRMIGSIARRAAAAASWRIGTGTAIGAAFSAPTASAKSALVISPRRHIAHSALVASAKRSSGAMSIRS
jgi:hypothetical protein